MRRTALCLAAALTVVPASQVRAQWEEDRESYGLGRPFGDAGGSLVVAVPVGEFANFVQAGVGLDGFFLIRLDRRGAVGLKVDGGFLIYGSETRGRPLSPTVPFVDVYVTTRNNIGYLSIGPQFMRPRGAVRPYVHAGIGFSYFATVSSVRGTLSSEDFASSTNFDDFTFATRSGGGLLIMVSRGRTPVAIDLHANYLRNGRVRYLTEGSIEELPSGGLAYHPIESETNLMLFGIGVSVGLRPRRAW